MIVCGPTRASDGVKIPPLTPGPLKVPPAGDSPVPTSENGGELAQVDLPGGQMIGHTEHCVVIKIAFTPLDARKVKPYGKLGFITI